MSDPGAVPVPVPVPVPVVIGSVTLPGVRPSVGRARRFARELLPCAGPWLDDLATVVSETVCNAITHTRSGGDGGRVTVTVLACAGGYRLEVADDGAGGDRPRVEPETGTERGRGMRIVDALAVRWGYRERGQRTVVWAEFAARDASVCTPGCRTRLGGCSDDEADRTADRR